MSSEEANSGLFLLGAGPLLGAALNPEALASARANSTAIAKRMTFPRVGLSRLVQERNHAWPFCGARAAICRRHLPRKPRLWHNVGSRPVERGCPMRRAILTAAVAA